MNYPPPRSAAAAANHPYYPSSFVFEDDDEDEEAGTTALDAPYACCWNNHQQESALNRSMPSLASFSAASSSQYDSSSVASYYSGSLGSPTWRRDNTTKSLLSLVSTTTSSSNVSMVSSCATGTSFPWSFASEGGPPPPPPPPSREEEEKKYSPSTSHEEDKEEDDDDDSSLQHSDWEGDDDVDAKPPRLPFRPSTVVTPRSVVRTTTTSTTSWPRQYDQEADVAATARPPEGPTTMTPTTTTTTSSPPEVRLPKIHEDDEDDDEDERMTPRSSSASSRRHHDYYYRMGWICLILSLGAAVSMTLVLLLVRWIGTDDTSSAHGYPTAAGSSSTTTTTTSPRLCPLPQYRQLEEEEESHLYPYVSNDTDDDETDWEVIWRSSSTASDSPSTILPDEDDVSALIALVYPLLQAMVAPYFDVPPAAAATTHGDNNHEKDDSSSSLCFPYTRAQEDALQWVVQEWIASIQTIDFDYWKAQGWIMIAPPPNEDDEDTTSTDLLLPPQVILTSSNLHRYYTPQAWLQTVVLTLAWQSWMMDTTTTTMSADDDPHDLETRIVKRHDSTLAPLPLSPLNVCAWKGIHCHEGRISITTTTTTTHPIDDDDEEEEATTQPQPGDTRVMSLQWNQRDTPLHGTIPSELALLTQLRLLDLSHNAGLTGNFSGALLQHGLQALYLQETGLTGFDVNEEDDDEEEEESSSASALMDLRVAAHQGPPTGTLLRVLMNLKWMDWQPAAAILASDDGPGGWRKNDEAGVLPTEIGHLIHLEGLSLEQNGLTGTLPVEIQKLTSLVSLDLSGNRLEAIPPQVGDLIELEWLSVADNDLRALPATKLVSLPNLRYLELGGNPQLDRWSLLTVLEGVSLGCDCGQWSSSFPTSAAAWQGVMEMVDPIPEICSCIDERNAANERG